MRLVRKIGRTLAFAVALAAGSATARAAEEPAFTATATVDRNEMDPNDTVFFTLEVQTKKKVEPDIPSTRELLEGPLAAFRLIKEWTESGARSTVKSDDGGLKAETIRTRTQHFVLEPKGAGTLRIPSISISGGGETHATDPISIRVAPGASAQARPRRGGPQGRPGGPPAPQPSFPDEEDDEDLFALLLRRQGIPVPPGFGGRGAGPGAPGFPGGGGGGGFRTQPLNPQDAFFVQVDVDKTEAYVGEQITASWYLYTRGLIRDLDTLKYPSLRGFWKEDIEIATHLNFTQEVVNGIPYKKALLASFALFPIKEGTAIIDPYTAKCTVISMDDPFGALSGQAYAYSKSSREAKVKVKAVPAEGRPADFSGAVGDFQVSARVEDPKVIENQPFSLKIRFEGRGNAKLIEMPPFQVPEGMELYDTQKDSKFFRTGTSFKDFNVLLIPRRSGTFTLPSVSASIFDPARGAFVQRSTEPIVVIAQPGPPGSAVAVGTAGSRPEGKDATAPVKPYEPMIDLELRAGVSLADRAQAWGLAGAWALALGALGWRACAKLGWGRRKPSLERRIKARFRKIEALAAKGDWRAAGREGTNAVYWALGEASGQGGANVEIEKLLMRAPPSVRRELGDEAARALEKFQALAFAPEQAVGSLKERAAIEALLKSTEALLIRAAALSKSAARSAEFA